MFGLDKRLVVLATLMSCAAAAMFFTPGITASLAPPTATHAQAQNVASTGHLFSGNCESATWPNIPEECLTRAATSGGELQIAGAQ